MDRQWGTEMGEQGRRKVESDTSHLYMIPSSLFVRCFFVYLVCVCDCDCSYSIDLCDGEKDSIDEGS